MHLHMKLAESTLNAILQLSFFDNEKIDKFAVNYKRLCRC